MYVIMFLSIFLCKQFIFQLTTANHVFMVGNHLDNFLILLTNFKMDCWWNAAVENQGCFYFILCKSTQYILLSYRPGSQDWTGENSLCDALHCDLSFIPLVYN